MTLDRAEQRLMQLFEVMDELYNDDLNFQYVRKIISQLESEVSSNKDFFSVRNREFRQKKIERLISTMTTGNEQIYDFVKYEYSSPFGLLASIMNLDIPDVAISNILIKLQLNTKVFRNIEVPENLHEAFAFFLEHLVSNLKFINERKLGVADAIMDSSFGNFRFNVVHNSINSNKGPIVTVRKHVQGIQKSENELDADGYEKSLNVSSETIEKLKEYSGKSVIIFGEPGSGKTTLLRYLIMHKLDEKRNLCIIEDTPELGVPVNISLVTNRYNTIKDLFTTALRQNPSHMAIGETRTDEIVDIMEAGLTFSVSTSIHASSFQRSLERIYFMSRSRQLSKSDINDLIAASVDMFVYMDEREVAGVWVRNNKMTGDVYEKYDEIDIGKVEEQVNNIKIEAGV